MAPYCNRSKCERTLTVSEQYQRVTFSRLTTTYFVFSVAHFAIQLVLQIMAFQVNANAASFLDKIIVEGNGTVQGFTILGSDLRLCTTVPSKALDTSSCEVIWDASMHSGPPVNVSNLAWSDPDGNSAPADVATPFEDPITPLSSFLLSFDSTSTLPPSAAFSTALTTPTGTVAVTTAHVTHTITVVVETAAPSKRSPVDQDFVKVSSICILLKLAEPCS